MRTVSSSEDIDGHKTGESIEFSLRGGKYITRLIFIKIFIYFSISRGKLMIRRNPRERDPRRGHRPRRKTKDRD